MKFIPALVLALCPLVAVAHGDLHERIDAISARLQADPANATLYLERGELRRQHGEWVEAIDDFAAAEGLDPKLDGVELARGRTLMASHDWLAACTALNRHVQRHPDHAAALLLRARCRLAIGDYRAAVADFDRGIAQCPDPQPDDFLDRANALLALGSADAALRGLDEGLARLGPAIALQLRAIDLEAAAGRIDSALARISRVAGSSALSVDLLERRATLLRRAGRNAEAGEAAREALLLLEALPPARRSVTSVTERERRLRAMLAASP